MPRAVNEKEPSAFGISPNMARALADPWRIRILIEATVRPLSPSTFVAEVGGELTFIARCFRQMADWGCIELVEKRPGRRKGAAVEHVYRAIRRAHFDSYSWEGVPRSERDAASRSILSSYERRIVEALEAGTFDQEVDRHLSWDAVALDQIAWKEITTRLDAVLDSLSNVEFEANQRLSVVGGELIPAIVGLTAFRSPGSPSLMLRGARRYQGPADVTEPGAYFGIGPKLANALSNHWRCKILMEVSIRPMSPSQFVDEVGGSRTYISRCFRELFEWGYLEVVEEKRGGRRRGGVERIFRSTLRPYFDTPTWEALPQIVREEMSQFFLGTYFERISEAVDAQTFDADPDRHLSWKPVVLDRSAWSQIVTCLDDVLGKLPDLESQSLERMRDLEQLIPTTVGLAAFRSPPQDGEAESNRIR